MQTAIKKLSVGLIALVLASVIASCSGKSQRLVPQPYDKKEKIDNEVDAIQIVGPKVDILFVIDNSGSMGGHQQNLSQNIDGFVNEITQGGTLVDYRIGVTTTDNSIIGGTLLRTPGRGPMYVDKFTPGGANILKQRMIVGTGGSGTEEMFNPVWRAFSPPLETGENKGFLRPDAFLAIVWITDAEDQSQSSHPSMTGPRLVSFLDGLKGPGKWMTYGAILPVGALPASCERSEDEPRMLQQFLTTTTSQYFSLCAPDFGKNLASLGSNLVSKIGRTILLSRFPVVETIQVSYGTQVIDNDHLTGWYYVPAQNALAFGKDLVLTQQPPGTQFKVSFVSKIEEE